MAAQSSTFPTGGTLLATTNSPFSSATLQGRLITSVYSGGGDPYAGGLTFTYLLELNSSSTDSSSEFTVGGFAGYSTDVSFNQSAGEIAPSTFMRSGNGGVIHSQWNTSIELPSGDTGALVVVQTSATSFGGNFGAVIDSTSVTVPILAPVPEPGTVGLMAIGLGALFIVRRRSSK